MGSEMCIRDSANADLVTVKTLASGNATPLEGEVVTFEIEVTNNGTAQATNVSLIDLLPSGLTATGGNGVTTQGTYDAPPVCSISERSTLVKRLF